MAKEIAKFAAEMKKITPLSKMFSLDALTKARRTHSLYIGDTSASGESHLGEAMATARENGVTGSTLADFKKDKGFAKALDAFETAIKQVQGNKQMFDTLKDGAGKTLKMAMDLKADIAKDLKSRKDSSATKTDIQKLGDEVDKLVKDLKAASAIVLNKRDESYGDNGPAHVARVLKGAPDVQKGARDATMLPQMLVDRNRKKQLTLGLSAFKRVKASCDAAMTAAEKDLSAAKPHLVAAAKEATTVSQLRDAYKKAVDFADSKKDLAGTKDEAAVRKVLADLNKAADQADRMVRGTMTTIKKAG